MNNLIKKMFVTGMIFTLFFGVEMYAQNVTGKVSGAEDVP